MNKIYTLLAGMLVSAGLMAQNYNVTFQVDMSNETPSSNGVHIAGDFQSEAGASGDWVPDETELTDLNADDIYDVTVSIPGGRYEYKFINDNDWAGVESVPNACQVEEGTGNNNRYLWISSDTVLPAIVFSGAAPAGMQFVKLKVDMRDQLESTSTPDVMGEFNGWSDYVQLYDSEMDSIYYNYVYWGGDTMTYKFRNTHDWNDAESVTDPACGGAGGFGNDRWIDASSDVISDENCYGSCGPCVAPAATDTIMVTIRVDFSYEKVCSNPDSVDVTGAGDAFGNWGGDPVMMDDSDGDDIWEVTMELLTNTDYEFKFRSWLGVNVKWEASANRTMNISVANDTTLPVVCFEQTTSCAASGPAPFGPADVTFAVDMSDEVPGDTIWVMGSFTDPQWQGGAIALDFTGEGAVFATTVEICPNNFQFKWVNGDVNSPTNEEFNGDTTGLPCNVDNGVGGYNRSVSRTSANDTTIAFKFNTCDTFTYTPAGVEEHMSNFDVMLFPNPVKDNFTITSGSGSNISGVKVMDMSGRLVTEISGNARNTMTLSTSELNMKHGLYLIEVSSVDGSRALLKVTSL